VMRGTWQLLYQGGGCHFAGALLSPAAARSATAEASTGPRLAGACGRGNADGPKPMRTPKKRSGLYSDRLFFLNAFPDSGFVVGLRRQYGFWHRLPYPPLSAATTGARALRTLHWTNAQALRAIVEKLAVRGAQKIVGGTCHHVGTNFSQGGQKSVSPPPPPPPSRRRAAASNGAPPAGFAAPHIRGPPVQTARPAWPNAHRRGALGSQLGAVPGGKADPAGECGGDGGTSRRRPRGNC
jgi:hypothetical protein